MFKWFICFEITGKPAGRNPLLNLTNWSVPWEPLYSAVQFRAKPVGRTPFLNLTNCCEGVRACWVSAHFGSSCPIAVKPCRPNVVANGRLPNLSRQRSREIQPSTELQSLTCSPCTQLHWKTRQTRMRHYSMRWWSLGATLKAWILTLCRLRRNSGRTKQHLLNVLTNAGNP